MSSFERNQTEIQEDIRAGFSALGVRGIGLSSIPSPPTIGLPRGR
jgi:hypothetical protein